MTMIFISYTRNDREKIFPITKFLKESDIEYWLDSERLIGGQDWNHFIRRALNEANMIIICMSNNSITHRGYVQRELSEALDRAETMLEDDVFIIPILLESVHPIPERMRRYQWIRLDDENWKHSLRSSIEYQIKRLELSKTVLDKEEPLISIGLLKERCSNYPKYEVEIQTVRFNCKSLIPEIDLLNSLLSGEDVRDFISQRAEREFRLPDRVVDDGPFSEIASKFEVRYISHHLGRKVLSLTREFYFYPSGAAHGNYWYRTRNFLLNPLTEIKTAWELFKPSSGAFDAVQFQVRKNIRPVEFVPDGSYSYDTNWLNSGTEREDRFHTFSFSDSGLQFYFPSYQVGPFSDGVHGGTVPYASILEFLLPRIFDRIMAATSKV